MSAITSSTTLISTNILGEPTLKKRKLFNSDEVEHAEHLDALKKLDAIDLKRPVIVRAMPLKSGSTGEKILHLIRHGQGFHNLIATMYRNNDKTWKTDTYSPDNPYCLKELLDPPLTEIGREEAENLYKSLHKKSQKKTLGISVELIVVSPLRRAIQTAIIAYQHLYNDNKTRWVATDLVRETMGAHICDKRRKISKKKLEFPYIDYSNIANDDDTDWKEDHRETRLACSDRGYQFALWLRSQKEKEIAVVAHSSFLLSLMNTVFVCSSDNLKKWFHTGEMRSMHISFEDVKHENEKDS